MTDRASHGPTWHTDRMKQLRWLVVLVCACSSNSSPPSHPSDLGACSPIEQDGKAYYLCERTGGGAAPIANHAAPAANAEADGPEAAMRKAEQDAIQAVKDAQEAMERLDRLQTDLTALDTKVSAAIDTVIAAQNDADRAAAKARLEQLRAEKAEMDRRIMEAKAKAVRAERKKGVKVDARCLDNPLAKGCE